MSETSESTYAGDVGFLARHTEVVELTGPDDALVAVAPSYQGRIMTSSLAGGEGTSFGWLNRPFIESARDDPHFNNYGGEDRFWLGPEAGQFGLWFQQGEPFDLDHWKTPPSFGRGAFEVINQRPNSISTAAQFEVTNYARATFRCAVKRTISTLDRHRSAELLGATVPAGLSIVGFESHNTLTNAGDGAWIRPTGLLSIWTLGQFKTLLRGVVIVPFLTGDEAALGPRAATDYFGELPPERCKLFEDHLLFRCDGKCRSKIGISPARARNICGSYDPDAGLLTIVQFNLPPDAAKLPYVNSLWEIQDSLEKNFAGDVVNSYNDGPESGHDTLSNPFYEIETSSPAAELKSGESITHIHRTFHFKGPLQAVNVLAEKVLGADLSDIE